MTVTGEPVVIDLGTGWREPLPEDLRPRRPVRLTALGLALALAVVLGGAAPYPGPRELGRIALTTTTDAFQIIGDQLVVQDGARLSGHRLTDGTPLWSVPVPPSSGGASLRSPVPGTVLVSLQDGRGRPYTAAVDTARGVLLWEAEAAQAPIGGTADAVVLQDERGDSGFTVRELSTGRVRWSGRGMVTVDPDRAAAAEGPLSLWVLSASGTVTEHDLRDGRVLRTGVAEVGQGDPRYLLALGGELLIDYAVDGVSRQVRLDRRSLAPVPPERPFVRRLDCGAYWCVVSQLLMEPAEIPMEVVDKVTGAVVHRMAADRLVEAGRWGLLQAEPQPGVRGLPLATLIEPGTGRLLAELTGWELLLDQPRPVELLVRGPSDGPVQFARLTPAGLEAVAELPGRVGRCAFAQRVLVCSVENDRLTLWRWDA